jgi:6,7-dimethyl-8-ribityllumazine synthase
MQRAWALRAALRVLRDTALCCCAAGVPVVFGVLTCDTMEQVSMQPLLQHTAPAAARSNLTAQYSMTAVAVLWRHCARQHHFELAKFAP